MNTERFTSPLLRLLDLAEQTQKTRVETCARVAAIDEVETQISHAANILVEGGLNPIGPAATMLIAALREFDGAHQERYERGILAWGMVVGILIPFVQSYLGDALKLREKLSEMGRSNA